MPCQVSGPEVTSVFVAASCDIDVAGAGAVLELACWAEAGAPAVAATSAKTREAAADIIEFVRRVSMINHLPCPTIAPC
jgi:hypothetical protein